MVALHRVWSLLLSLALMACGTGQQPASAVPEPAQQHPPRSADEPPPPVASTPGEVGPSGGAQRVCLKHGARAEECVLDARQIQDFNLSELQGKRIGSPESTVERGHHCTKKVCFAERPCCNSCRTRVRLPDQRVLIAEQSSALLDGQCVDPAKRYAFVGTIDVESNGRRLLKLDWLEEVRD